MNSHSFKHDRRGIQRISGNGEDVPLLYRNSSNVFTLKDVFLAIGLLMAIPAFIIGIIALAQQHDGKLESGDIENLNITGVLNVTNAVIIDPMRNVAGLYIGNITYGDGGIESIGAVFSADGGFTITGRVEAPELFPPFDIADYETGFHGTWEWLGGNNYRSVGMQYRQGKLNPFLKNMNNILSATSGSNVVSVMYPSHGLSTGNFVRILNLQTDLQGIPKEEINLTHQITVTGPNTFTIIVTTNATGTSPSPEGGMVTLYDVRPNDGNGALNWFATAKTEFTIIDGIFSASMHQIAAGYVDFRIPDNTHLVPIFPVVSFVMRKHSIQEMFDIIPTF